MHSSVTKSAPSEGAECELLSSSPHERPRQSTVDFDQVLISFRASSRQPSQQRAGVPPSRPTLRGGAPALLLRVPRRIHASVRRECSGSSKITCMTNVHRNCPMQGQAGHHQQQQDPSGTHFCKERPSFDSLASLTRRIESHTVPL